MKYNAFIPGFVLFDLQSNVGSIQYYNENHEILHEASFPRLTKAKRQCDLETAV